MRGVRLTRGRASRQFSSVNYGRGTCSSLHAGCWLTRNDTCMLSCSMGLAILFLLPNLFPQSINRSIRAGAWVWSQRLFAFLHSPACGLQIIPYMYVMSGHVMSCTTFMCYLCPLHVLHGRYHGGSHPPSSPFLCFHTPSRYRSCTCRQGREGSGASGALLGVGVYCRGEEDSTPST